jgi:transcriptional regulator with GAF, ATPase, and Fis domain
MSTAELDRLQILQKIMKHRMTQAAAAHALGLSYRQVERLMARFHVTAVNRLIRQTHYERQGDIQPRNILIV